MDATTTQQGRHTAVMRPVVTMTMTVVTRWKRNANLVGVLSVGLVNLGAHVVEATASGRHQPRELGDLVLERPD